MPISDEEINKANAKKDTSDKKQRRTKSLQCHLLLHLDYHLKTSLLKG